MADRRIQCPVEDESEAATALEVNAFRILPEAGGAYFLDFIHYSPARQRAEVVSRVHVHKEALESIRSRLASDMQEVPEADITVVMPMPVAVN